MNALITRNALQSVVAALTITSVLCMLYFVLEPQVGRAVTSNPFAVRQEITGEISFQPGPATVEMFDDLSGLTGGNATATTYAVVRTNSPGGYYMDITWTDTDGDGTVMRRDLGGTYDDSIKNYATSSYNRMVTPSYNFSFASSASMFAYTVTASDTADVHQNFLNNGSNTCGTGADDTADVCWMAPTTTPYRIINRTTSAAEGSTTTLKFRVYIPSSPNPPVETGFYTATATLTAVINP